ncbi:MAG: hypothetical protein JWN44_7285 [Myxococcales bacterium]|nr:hypothetical protein [Myxococcales bacterium]
MGDGASALVADATLVRLDVYGATGHCGADGLLAAGSGRPVASGTYVRGQPITLDVPPGSHTLLLTTFADEAGTMLLGEACTEADLAAGAQLCFDLTLVSVEGIDFGVVVPCSETVDCPKGSYCSALQCEPGCATDNDCRADSDGGISATPLCDPATHRCVECLSAADCPNGLHATATDCVASKCVATCSAGYSNCNGAVSDGCECNTDPTAPACCASGCQTQHSNGWGGSYYDCGPIGQPGVTGTFTSAMANLAAFSDSGQPGTPSGGWNCGSNGNTTASICKSVGGNKGECTCWVYAATGTYVDRIGHTFHSAASGCLCPFSSDPPWN